MDTYRKEFQGSLGLGRLIRLLAPVVCGISIIASVACYASNPPTLSYSRIEASYPMYRVENITPKTLDAAVAARLHNYEWTCHQKDISADQIATLFERHLYAVLRVQWNITDQLAFVAPHHFPLLARFVQDVLPHDNGLPVVLCATVKDEVLYVCFSSCEEGLLRNEPNQWAEALDAPSSLCVDLKFHNGSTFGKKLFPIEITTLEKYGDLWKELRSGS